MANAIGWKSLFRVVSAVAVLLGFSAQGLSAQQRQWQVSQTDPNRPAVAIIPGSGTISGLGLICDKSQPFLLLNLTQPVGRNTASAVLTVDGQDYTVSMAVLRAPAVMSGMIADPALIDALAQGQGLSVAVNGRAVGSLPLTGSSAALKSALAGCWQSASATPTPDLASTPSPPQVSAADRTAIMRAAGFTRRGNAWTTCEGEETGDIAEMRDLNGDGSPEALVIGSGTACHGFAGSGFTVLTRQSGGWKVVYQQTGFPDFFPRAGIAWPDIEIGGPGSDCFPFLRWDGRAYVQGGTSLGGKICTVNPRFAGSSPPPGNAASGNSEGILGQIPVRLGYYVMDGEKCTNPGYLYKFERNRHLEIFAEGGRIEMLVYDYARVSGQQDGYYMVVLKNVGPEDPSDIGIKPFRGGSIELLVQDNVPLTHCQDSQIPARMRR